MDDASGASDAAASGYQPSTAAVVYRPARAASVRLSRGNPRGGIRPANPVWGRLSGAPAQLATVTVIRLDNKRILLPAPLVTAWASDPTFTDNARQLQQLCEEYAGAVELRSTLPHS